jgi:hypothetical protein
MPPGRVGQQSGGVGRHIDAEEDDPGQMRYRRQQLVEDRRGDRHVHCGEQYLKHRHSHAGQLDILPEQAHTAQHAGKRDVAEHDRPQQCPGAVHRGARQMGAEERDGARLDEQDGATQHHAAEGEGQAAERYRLGDLRGGQPPMGIQPEPHRRARHRSKAEIVRERIRAERGEGDTAVGDFVTRVDRAEPVVERQHEIRQHRPAKRQCQRPRRDRVQSSTDVAQPQMAELALHQVDCADQQCHAEQGGHIAEPRLHGLRNARTRRDGLRNARERRGIRWHQPGD